MSLLANTVKNQHILLSDEPRGDHLTNKCVSADVRDKGFSTSGWRGEVRMDVEYKGVGKVEMHATSNSLEIDIVLVEKPVSNIFIYDIQTENLDFHYQPELTQDEIDVGYVRPENVVGSYAVYHSTKKNNFRYANGTERNYRTGKAFHIFRPEASDANGKRVWCDLRITEEKTAFIVTVPQEFLDIAQYPVTVDPNFGYDDPDGWSWGTAAENVVQGIRTVMDDADGTLDSISLWVNDFMSNGPFNEWTAIYSNDAGNRVPLDLEEECTAPTEVPLDHNDWITCSHSGTFDLVANTVYWLAISRGANHRHYYDTVGSNDYAWDSIGSGQNTFKDPWPNTNNTTFIVAIYGTYSELPSPEPSPAPHEAVKLPIDLYTYEVMEGAVIHGVSSEDADNPAEHAIAPLEPNFSWEADESSAQHTVTIDLGEARSCDGFSFIHHELEIEGPPVSSSLQITIEYSSDATNWIAVNVAYNSDGTNSPNDLFDRFIKLRHFVDGSSNLISHIAQYWRFTIKGVTGPFFYAENDARLSMLWLFQIHQLDRGAAFPVNDTPIYPDASLKLPFGKTYRTGHSVNPHTLLTRTWMLTENEYAILRQVMRECNGAYRPFLFVDTDDVRRLCKFETDIVEEELLDVGLYRVTFRFVELPIVRKDGYH